MKASNTARQPACEGSAMKRQLRRIFCKRKFAPHIWVEHRSELMTNMFGAPSCFATTEDTCNFTRPSSAGAPNKCRESKLERRLFVDTRMEFSMVRNQSSVATRGACAAFFATDFCFSAEPESFFAKNRANCAFHPSFSLSLSGTPGLESLWRQSLCTCSGAGRWRQNVPEDGRNRAI